MKEFAWNNNYGNSSSTSYNEIFSYHVPAFRIWDIPLANAYQSSNNANVFFCTVKKTHKL